MVLLKKEKEIEAFKIQISDFEELKKKQIDDFKLIEVKIFYKCFQFNI